MVFLNAIWLQAEKQNIHDLLVYEGNSTRNAVKEPLFLYLHWLNKIKRFYVGIA